MLTVFSDLFGWEKEEEQTTQSSPVPLHKLPRDVLYSMCLHHFSCHDVCSLSMVNKCLNNTLSESTLWNQLSQRDFFTSGFRWRNYGWKVFQLPPSYTERRFTHEINYSFYPPPLYFTFKRIQNASSSPEITVYFVGLWSFTRNPAPHNFPHNEGKEFPYVK